MAEARGGEGAGDLGVRSAAARRRLLAMIRGRAEGLVVEGAVVPPPARPVTARGSGGGAYAAGRGATGGVAPRQSHPRRQRLASSL
jgi:hypothetical protein